MAVGFHRDESGAADLLRADQPAGELGGERGLAFAALAAHHGIAGPPHPWPLSPRCGEGRGGEEEALERQQLAAAADEAGLRRRRQFAETGRERGTRVRYRLLRGPRSEELGVLLLLEEHGHEPVLEPQRTRAEDAAAEGVVLERALACQHGVAHASPPASAA